MLRSGERRVYPFSVREWRACTGILKPDFALRVKVEPIQPQIEAVVRNAVRIGTDQIGVRATVEYTVKRAGVFRPLRTSLPVDYRVEAVTGSNISQWIEKAGNTNEALLRKELEVTLNERMTGAYTLTVDLVRSARVAEGDSGDRRSALGDGENSRVCVGLFRRRRAGEDGTVYRSTEVPLSALGMSSESGTGALAFKLIPGETAQPGVDS